MTDFQTLLEQLKTQVRFVLKSSTFAYTAIHIRTPNGDPKNPNAIWDDGNIRFKDIEHMSGQSQENGISHEVQFLTDASVYVEGDWEGKAWYNSEANCSNTIHDPTMTSTSGTHHVDTNTGHFTMVPWNMTDYGNRSMNDLFHLGAGDDWVEAKTGNDTVYAGKGRDVVYGGTGDDLLYGEADTDFLFGDDGNDYLDGGDDDDYLDGGIGDDTLVGGTGDDYMIGGEGHDLMTGGAGNDYLLGGAGNDTMYGHDGNDTLLGGDGNDIFDAGDGNDQMTGGAGDDIFHGGPGDDQMWGGAGNDTYLYTPGFGIDHIMEYGNAEIDGTSDMVYLAGSMSASVLQNGNDLILAFTQTDQLVLSNWFTNKGVEYIYFADGEVLYSVEALSVLARDITSSDPDLSPDLTPTDLSGLNPVSVNVAGVAPQLDALAHAFIQ